MKTTITLLIATFSLPLFAADLQKQPPEEKLISPESIYDYSLKQFTAAYADAIVELQKTEAAESFGSDSENSRKIKYQVQFLKVEMAKTILETFLKEIRLKPFTDAQINKMDSSVKFLENELAKEETLLSNLKKGN